jgi:SpoVK/Ycf46/Vps4 family AAA+-type ATPase
VPLPDNKTRLEIIKVHTKEKPLAQDIVLETLVELTKGYSGAEIAAVCNEAAIKALEEMVTCYDNNLQACGDDSIKMKHFDIALSSIAPRITAESLEMYNAFKTKNH